MQVKSYYYFFKSYQNHIKYVILTNPFELSLARDEEGRMSRRALYGAELRLAALGLGPLLNCRQRLPGSDALMMQRLRFLLLHMPCVNCWSSSRRISMLGFKRTSAQFTLTLLKCR